MRLINLSTDPIALGQLLAVRELDRGMVADIESKDFDVLYGSTRCLKQVEEISKEESSIVPKVNQKMALLVVHQRLLKHPPI